MQGVHRVPLARLDVKDFRRRSCLVLVVWQGQATRRDDERLLQEADRCAEARLPQLTNLCGHERRVDSNGRLQGTIVLDTTDHVDAAVLQLNCREGLRDDDLPTQWLTREGLLLEVEQINVLRVWLEVVEGVDSLVAVALDHVLSTVTGREAGSGTHLANAHGIKIALIEHERGVLVLFEVDRLHV